MFLPIGDSPNPRGTPYVNYLLIGLNVGVFLLVSLPLMQAGPDLSDPLLLDFLRALGARGAVSVQAVQEQISAYDLFVFRHGYRPGDPSALSLFSAMFLHAGWLHLAGNMLFLWIFGDNVEHRLGALRYLAVYLGAGIAATLFFALFVPSSQVPLVGASGAISGVLGCYFLWFPRNQVKAFVFLFPFIMNTFMVPARLVLGFYLVVDNLLPFLLMRGGGGGVAHGAHLGGFLAGVAAAWGVDRLPTLRTRLGGGARRQETKAPPRKVRPGGGFDPVEQIAPLLRQGQAAQAAALYLALGRRQERTRVAAADVLSVGEYLLGAGRYDEALLVYRGFIATRPADPALDRAYLGAGKALMHRPRCVTSAYHYFLSALDVTRDRELEEEARLHLRGIEKLGGRS